ncbi:ABC transporter permease [Candidatus Acetothermia bacterium]|nr:MAG: ABC transporter permease [Candidatus Acetothermia bacterium]
MKGKNGWKGYRWFVSLGLIALLWYGVTAIFRVPTYLFPSPAVTVRAIVSDAGFLGRHVAITIVETLAGFGMAVFAGVTVAILMNASRLSRDLIYPPLVLSQAIPLIAIAPLILIWFGLGILAKVLIVAFVCFFPIAVNAYEGFRSVDPALRDLLEAFGAGRADRYRHLYVPATLPGILAGLKIAATYSVLGAVVGEWLGGSLGIGVYMTRALQSFRTDRLFGAILVVMLLSLCLFKLVDGASRRLTPWMERRDHD